MRKNIRGRAIVVWLFLFIMMFCVMALSAPAFSADKAIAKLTSFSGTVLIKSQGAWGVEPKKDLPLYSDDKIVTKMGVATITFDDGAVMEIKANSNFLIRETETGVSGQVGAVKRQLRLIIGKVLFRSGRGTSVNTTLETTTMVCGLRGTIGTLSIDASGVTYLYFTEGGGDTVGNFIAGIAPDVPAEIADLNEAQRAAFVANLAAEQAKQAAEKLKSGQATDAEAQLAAAVAAKAAAQEAKAAAEAMLNNPDESIREEARKAIAAADEAIRAADEAIEVFLDGADDQDLFGYYYGIFGDPLKRLTSTLAPQGNESEILIPHDTEAPVVVLSACPDIDGTTLTASFTNDEPGTVTYSFVDAETGEAISNTGLVSGTYYINVIATDQAGNKSTTPFSFTLDNEVFSGNISGSGSTISGTASGMASVIIGQGWGGWETIMTGGWSGEHTGSLSLASGGWTSTEGNWISIASGTVDTATGAASGTTEFIILDSTSLTRGIGTFTGDFGTGTAGDWALTETGEGLTNIPLAMSGNLTSDVFYYYNNPTGDTFASGNVGVVPNGSSFDYVILGSYANETGPGPYLSVADIYIDDELSAFTDTIWKDGLIKGFLTATYDDIGDGTTAGVFYNRISGNYYQGIGSNTGMWLSEGTITPIQLASGIDGTTRYIDPNTPDMYFFYFNGSGGNIAVDSEFSTGAALPMAVIDSGSLDMLFGTWVADLAGYYEAPPADGWALSLQGTPEEPDPVVYNLIEIGPGGSDDGNSTINSTWTSATEEISAFAAGSWINLDESVTGVLGGQLAGTFDPTNSVWQAVAAGGFIDTNTFLEMAATTEGRSRLSQLDIPCVQVGEVDLSGSGAYITSVQMNDVKFFAYTTGAPPTIWATGNVSGAVSVGGSPVGDVVNMTGTNFNATFTMDAYDTGTGNWNASVTGSGLVNNPVYIEGNAAGNDATSTGFTGTASGVSRVME